MTDPNPYEQDRIHTLSQASQQPTHKDPAIAQDQMQLTIMDAALEHDIFQVVPKLMQRVRDLKEVLSTLNEVQISRACPVKKVQSALKAMESARKEAKSALEEAKSALEEAKSARKEAESTLEEAESTLERAESTLEEAESTLERAESTLNEVHISMNEVQISPARPVKNALKTMESALMRDLKEVLSTLNEVQISRARPVKEVQSALKEAKSARKEAESTLNEVQISRARPVKVVQSALKEAKSALEEAKSALEEAKSARKEAESTLEEAVSTLEAVQSGLKFTRKWALKEMVKEGIPTLSQASQQPTHKDQVIAQDQMQATIMDTSTAALEHDIFQVVPKLMQRVRDLKEVLSTLNEVQISRARPVKEVQSALKEAKSARKEAESTLNEVQISRARSVKEVQSALKEAKSALEEAKSARKEAESTLEEAVSTLEAVQSGLKFTRKWALKEMVKEGIPTLSQASQQPTHKDLVIAQDQMQATIMDTSTAALEHDIFQVVPKLMQRVRDLKEVLSTLNEVQISRARPVKEVQSALKAMQSALKAVHSALKAESTLEVMQSGLKFTRSTLMLVKAQITLMLAQSTLSRFFPKPNQPTQGDPAITQPKRGLNKSTISFGQGEAFNKVLRVRDLKEAQSSHALSQSFPEPNQPTQGDPAITQRKRGFIASTISFGQDKAFNKVCDFLGGHDAGIVGIYGMGRVGKTTLMKKIRREFLEPLNYQVIWVAVSMAVDVFEIQKSIMVQMNLPFYEDEHPMHLAQKICIALKKKKVVLLFDDIWEFLDLEDIFCPIDLNTSSLCKILFTTRSEEVCNKMRPDLKVEVECLGWHDSWALFKKSVGSHTLQSNQKIQYLAREVAFECQGLPLALTVVGRAMTSKYSPEEWEHASNVLRKLPSEVCDAEKILFSLEDCPKLEKLPRGLMNENRTLEDGKIHGKQKSFSWLRLIRQNDALMSSLLHTFKIHADEDEEGDQVSISSQNQASKQRQLTQGDSKNIEAELPITELVTISGQDQNFYLSPSIQGHSIPTVLEPPQLDSVAILSSTPSMGQDGTFKEVWDFLKDNKVGMAGIYGMGGIGKTTLLKRINNELQGTCDFDVVILVVVSKEVSMDKIQKAILEKLGLPHYDENVNDQVVIFKALRRRKFLLLLDDLWEGLNLVKLGIPAPCDQNKSKVLFTTRYEVVCDKMLSSRKIKVNCMSREEVWDLFRENVGEEVLDAHPNIPNLAHKVAEKCKGLPLAVKVIARAMTCKMTIQQWKDALNTLCNVPYEISGTEKDLYYFVKFSYDMLPNKAIQNCFLYCTLFPQDYPIDEEELIKYWMEEGFLDGCENIDEVVNKGNHVIVTLKALCLLESVTDCVKMHDVIREMALLIASECVVNSGKFLVKSGIGLCEAPEAEKWRETQRISLMANEIIELPETPMCPKLMTLMLQRNNCLRISENFFQFMPLLRVLDLSNTGLRMLPGSISELVTLQYLNLSGTYLERVPKEIGDLQSLRCLDMSNILKMPPFPPEVTSRPSKLVYHILISQFSIFDPEYDESNISGLERLEFLYDLSICIRNFSSLMYLFGSQKLGQCITNLWIFLCGDMKCLQLSSFGSRLRTLHIGPCDSLEDIEVGGETSLEREYQILPRLEVLRVEYNYNLKKILVRNSLGQCLRRLTTLVIDGCWLLENIGWVKYLKSLEYLKVRVNYVLEELFSSQNEVEEGPITFPKLKQLRIVDLRELKRICGDVVAFPSLESLKVYGCPNLKKLPLGLLNENRTLRTIGGDEGWWCSLDWSDGMKSRFQPYFRNRQR